MGILTTALFGAAMACVLFGHPLVGLVVIVVATATIIITDKETQ